MVLNNCNKYYILYKNQDRKKAEFLVGFQRINTYKNKEKRIKYMSKAVLVMDMPSSCDKCPFCFDSYGPVSYTHLDVYKRQMYLLLVRNLLTMHIYSYQKELVIHLVDMRISSSID